MPSNILRDQIEKIADTGESEFKDILIVLGKNDPRADAIAGAALDAENNRSNMANPRDILPPPAKKWQTPKKISKTRALRSREHSLFANVALANVEAMKMDRFKESANDWAQQIFQQELYTKVHETTKKHFKDKTWQPKYLKLAESLRLTVHRDELLEFAEHSDQIRGIFPNRRLSPPRYAVSSRAGTVTGERYSTLAWGLEKIGAPAAWGAFDARGTNTTVAVLDTGVDADHPDLQRDGGGKKVVAWAEFNVDGELIEGSQPHDSDIHGTHVCGTIAGGNNSGKAIGVAPRCNLAVGKVLDGKNGGSDAQVLAGIDWAIESNVDVINLSLGGLNVEPFVNPAYQRALINALRAGIPVIAAIGNDGSQTSGAPGNDIFSFAVGAIDSNDRTAGFSGGRTQVLRSSPYIPPNHLPLVYSKPDVSAPGVNVYSCVPKGKWSHLNGTSMASPHVAGAVAAFLSAVSLHALAPHEKATLIKDILMGSVDDLGESGQDHRYGFGRINLFRAIDVAKELGY